MIAAPLFAAALSLAAQQAEPAPAATAPVVVAGDNGFQLKSADGAFLLELRGLLHADARQYVDDEDLRFRDTFVVRRVRLLIEATFGALVDFRVMPDFGNGTATAQDAYADVRPFTWLKLRAGKFKPPVGLERLQSASAIFFVGSRNLKLATSFERTEFDGGAAAKGDRSPEIVVFQRVQAAF